MRYKKIMWAEMKPNIYAGDTCDQIEHRWEAYADGDMDSEVLTQPITLCPKAFPAGTKISISVPECPKCGQEVELCKSNEFCDFNWEEWVLNEYS